MNFRSSYDAHYLFQSLYLGYYRYLFSMPCTLHEIVSRAICYVVIFCDRIGSVGQQVAYTHIFAIL